MRRRPAVRLRAALIALSACLAAPAGHATDRLEAMGDVVWSEARAGFGSFSGLGLTPDGSTFVTVSDKGYTAAGRLTRRNGQLTDVTLTRLDALRDRAGQALSGFSIDAEGLAIGRDGTVWVSFEAEHRVWGYATLSGPATVSLPRPPDFARLQNNSSLEALAIDATGALYTIPERSGRLDRPFPVYRFKDGGWSRFGAIPRSGPWLVTGAEVGPDGFLYVLERDFRMLGGFRSRIRRFTLGGGRIGPEELLLETRFGQLDNMEGISVWRDADGAIRLTLISDDNNHFLQSTRLVEYRLRPRVQTRPRLRTN